MPFLGIFPRETKDITFLWRGACEARLNLHKVRLKQTLENLEKLKISFWVEGTLVMIFDGWGGGGGWGSGHGGRVGANGVGVG